MNAIIRHIMRVTTSVKPVCLFFDFYKLYKYNNRFINYINVQQRNSSLLSNLKNISLTFKSPITVNRT